MQSLQVLNVSTSRGGCPREHAEGQDQSSPSSSPQGPPHLHRLLSPRQEGRRQTGLRTAPAGGQEGKHLTKGAERSYLATRFRALTNPLQDPKSQPFSSSQSPEILLPTRRGSGRARSGRGERGSCSRRAPKGAEEPGPAGGRAPHTPLARSRGRRRRKAEKSGPDPPRALPQRS